MPRLLAFIPHPDDESYSFGGTVALAAMAGWECVVFCASSGEKGQRHDGGPGGVAAEREAELAASCELLGALPPVFWRLRDGGLTGLDARETPVNAALRTYGPDVILALGPDGAYGHPDHTALHRWVTSQWAALPRPRPTLLFPVFPKGLFLPQYQKCIAMMGNPPNPPPEAIGSDRWHYEVDISSVRETKLAAIAAHRSQLPGGDPEALFPPGIIRALLDVERFEDASGDANPATAGLLATLSAKQTASRAES